MKSDFKENYVLPPLVRNLQGEESMMAALLAVVNSQVQFNVLDYESVWVRNHIGVED
jgi:hypothetical protein